MNTQLRAYCAGVLEASALIAVAIIPVFVNFYSFRVFEPDKHALLVTLAVLAALGGAAAVVEGRLGGLAQAVRRPLVAAALLVALTTTVSALTSVARRVSVLGSHERAQGLVALLAVLAVFGAVAWVARVPVRRRRIVAALLAGSVPVAALAVVQALGIELVLGQVESESRVFGTLSNPIFLGAYLMMVLPFTVARALAALRAGRVPVVGVLAVVGALQLAALLLSASRGPILGLAAGLWVMALAGATAGGRRKVAWGLVGLAVLGAAFLLAFNMPDSPLAPLREAPVIGRFGRIGDTSGGSEAARVRIWEAAGRLLAGEPERMATGHGPETLKYALLPYAEANMPGRAQADRLVDRAHNVLLDALIMTGLPGALALLLAYGAWLYTAVAAVGLAPERADRRLLAIMLAAGTVLGAASWLAWPVYAGALTLLGLAVGLVVYLIAALARGRAPEEPPALTALALLAVGSAAVVEAAFGIQTVTTQLLFWLAAGLLVAVAAGDAVEEEVSRPAPRRRASRGAADGATDGGQLTVTWSSGGAALGLALGALMASLVYSYFVYGTETLPDTLPVVAFVLIVSWLVGTVLAADAGESPFACAATALATVAVFVVLRAVALVIAQDAAALFAIHVWWLVALALLAGVWLRAPTRRLPFWSGPVGMSYGLLAALAVAVVFVFAVRPVQADIYFQSAMANFNAALATDDQARFQVGETLYERAVAVNPNEPLYPMRWGELYTSLGVGVIGADLQAGAVAFNRAQELMLRAEALEPRMPYHAFNRGHLQLLFAQSLPSDPPEQRQQVAADAAAAYEEAFRVLKYDPQVANEFALARLLEGRTDDAVALLEYSLRLDPDNAATYSALGQAYGVAGRLDQALQALEAALTQGVGGVDVLVALGDVHRQKGDVPTAINYYRQASFEAPENWGLLYNLGLLYRETGDLQQSVDTLMQAAELAPPSERPRVQEAIDMVMGGQAAPPVVP